MEQEQKQAQEQQQEVLKVEPTNVPTFSGAFTSKVYVEPFDERDYIVGMVGDLQSDKELKMHLARMQDARLYKDDALAESHSTASASLKFKALKVNEQMIADIDSKLEGYTQQATQSNQTQQLSELQKQSAFIYFQTFSQVAGPEQMVAFAEANKDSIELLSLVKLKLDATAGDYTLVEGKSRVNQLLREAQGIPEKEKLMEVKKVLVSNRDFIRKDGLMYMPQQKGFININRMLEGGNPFPEEM